MKIAELCTWLINTVADLKEGKAGLIFHAKEGKISFEKIHNIKGSAVKEEDKQDA